MTASEPLRFVVNRHDATTLHFDLRLEVDGVLVSWAVPKGPSLDPKAKRLAVQVGGPRHGAPRVRRAFREEDGRVQTKIVWDTGLYLPAEPPGPALDAGHLRFVVSGHKLRGAFALTHTRMGGGDRNWLLVKVDDEFADPDPRPDGRRERVGAVRRHQRGARSRRAEPAPARSCPSSASTRRSATPRSRASRRAEVDGRRQKMQRTPIFVVQRHDASTLHFDFRLEVDGALVSWAVPKGPSLDPRDKRLAVRVEDHAMEHADFEGRSSDGYGRGTVIVWDTGGFENITEKDGDPSTRRPPSRRGHIKVLLHGREAHGRVRAHPHQDGRQREELDAGQGRRRGRRPPAQADRRRRTSPCVSGKTNEDFEAGSSSFLRAFASPCACRRTSAQGSVAARQPPAYGRRR